MRLGIFGGSFDPIHNGHLQLAECCCAQAGLDAVWFVPAAVQPHKPHGPVASDADRVAMLRLAIEEKPCLAVSTIEIDRGGVSYTVDTLRSIQEDQPAAKLFFLMGADTLHDLPNWYEPAEVLRLATPLVVHRAGEPAPDFEVLVGLVDAERLTEIRDLQVEMPPVDISSSDLRERFATDEPCEGLLPSTVAEWIAERQIYPE